MNNFNKEDEFSKKLINNALKSENDIENNRLFTREEIELKFEVLKGLEDVKNGKTISTKELLKKIDLTYKKKMDIYKMKLEVIGLILQTEDRDLLLKIKEILKEGLKEEEESLK